MLINVGELDEADAMMRELREMDSGDHIAFKPPDRGEGAEPCELVRVQLLAGMADAGPDAAYLANDAKFADVESTETCVRYLETVNRRNED